MLDRRRLLIGTGALTLAACSGQGGGATRLLNVSYDPTREFYQDYNPLFDEEWRRRGNPGLTVEQSHGGSGRQARSIIDGLEADVATLALAGDIDELARRGLVAQNWETRLPNNSAPY
ncbi:MAG: substrate-binding domain-containing protein, partial [Brevundimonas sp.]